MSHLKSVYFKQNNILCNMTFSNMVQMFTSLIYKKNKFLKVQDIYKLEFAKLMHRFHNRLRPVFTVSVLENIGFIYIIQDMLVMKIILILVSIVTLVKINILQAIGREDHLKCKTYLSTFIKKQSVITGYHITKFLILF